MPRLSSLRDSDTGDRSDWVKEIQRAGRTSGRIISVDAPVVAVPAQHVAVAPLAPPPSLPAAPVAESKKETESLLKGLFSIVVTPFSTNGAIDRQVISDYASALKADGVDGIICGAGPSEAKLLDIEERKTLISSWCSYGLTVVVDVTANSLSETKTLAAHARSCGAKLLVVELPDTFEPLTSIDYSAYVVEAARAIGDSPFLIRYNPGTRCGISCRVKDILNDSAPRASNLKGLLYCDANVNEYLHATTLVKSFPQLSTFVYANDGTMSVAALLGVQCFASIHFSTIAPLLAKIISASQKSESSNLQKYSCLSAKYFDLVETVSNGERNINRTTAVVKTLTSLRLERDLGYMRLPGPRLSVSEMQTLRTGMEDFVRSYVALVKTVAPRPAKIDLTGMPGFTGKLDDKIRRRAEDCGRKAGIQNILEWFPHLNQSWRGRLPGRDCDVSQFIDHTLLKPEGTEKEVSKLNAEAKQHRFFAVCVNGSRVDQCVSELRGTPIAIAAVIGFPLGAMTSKAKAREAKELVQKGCAEIDMVMNVGAMKDGDLKRVFEDIKAVVDASRPAGVKVIFESCLLSADEIMDASILSVAAGAAFLKTSTGFNKGGATPEAIDIMLAVAGNECSVKASGGVRTAEDAMAYITAGVKRIGTSSGVAIVSGTAAGGGY